VAVVKDAGEGMLHVVHLERLPLNTSYVEVVDHVEGMARDPRLASSSGSPPVLCVDQTGVGAAVTNMLLECGLAFYAVTIIATGKAKAYAVEGGRVSVRVSKGELLEALAAPLRAGRLKVALRLRWGPAFAEELSAFRRKQDARTAHVRFEHDRATDKDDLILGTALACWGPACNTLDDARRAASMSPIWSSLGRGPCEGFGFG